ncbi:substrate-binding domain-containing protein [Evansella halocellulosilytica]|uniref:substrate-binding domain-containing protein n=1 Tax=Evansella halocellulosilytica TaxID=2011013 RepID=UPI000BB7115D|nr:substrate-binding domain-containing protein [Evansella halocellulosilytica]
MKIIVHFLLSFLSALLLSSCSSQADSNSNELLLATTTSTYDSGLLDELIPAFAEETSTHVKVISVGSGQALKMGEQGEADVLLVHSPEAEEELEKAGIVINRHRVMHNDFILLGPIQNPDDITNDNIINALEEIRQIDASFFSRGDDSGTHHKELDLWEEAAITPDFQQYQETGQGMSETLRIANELEGYVLTDRGTYLYLKDSLPSLDIIVEGDEQLENIYHVMQVNPDRSSQINRADAEAFVSFFTSEKTKTLIEQYGIDMWGEPLFYPYMESER